MKRFSIHLPNDRGKKYEMFKYPAGELQVRLTPESIIELSETDEEVVITAQLQGEIMELALLTDAIQDLTLMPMTLFLPYLPYSRADRRFVAGDCDGLKTFGKFIDSLGFDRVVTVDVHSSHARRLISNLEVLGVEPIINDIAKRLLNPVILFPDEGSVHRYRELERWPELHCSKKRDSASGKLSGFAVPSVQELSRWDSILIIDDICDGGGTFVGIADELKNEGITQPLYLYVTHGIFSKGLEHLGRRFAKIFSTDTIPQGSATMVTVYPAPIPEFDCD